MLQTSQTHPLVVHAVQSRRDQRRFLDFPEWLYRRDPLWVPPLRGDEWRITGFKKHPFYQRNQSQAFLAMRGNEVCGRIAAIHNRDHNEYCGEQRGFFGFFECCDDPQAAEALMEAVRTWARQRGLTQLRGPVNPSLTYSAGALVDGFDRPPAFLMPYNPPYYDSLIQGCGFHKEQDLYAYYGHIDMLNPVRTRLLPLAEQITQRFQVNARCLDRSRLREDLANFLTILNQSMVGHWGYVPFSAAEIDYFASALRWLLTPKLAVGIEIGGRLVGVALALPDYSDRVRSIRGRLYPWNLPRLLMRKKSIKKYRVISAHVLPEYHRLGLGLVLVKAMAFNAREWGAEEVEFSWIAESNSLSRGSLEKGGAKRIKTYRIYDADL